MGPLHRVVQLGVAMSLLFGTLHADDTLIDTKNISVHVGRGLKKGSEVVGDVRPRVLANSTEDVLVSLEPESTVLSLYPSVVPPGNSIQLLVLDPHALYAKPVHEYQVLAVGVITGRQQNLSVSVSTNGGTEDSVPRFEQSSHDFTLDEPGKPDVVVGLVKLLNPDSIVSSYSLELIGAYSNRFFAYVEKSVVTIVSATCEERKDGKIKGNNKKEGDPEMKEKDPCGLPTSVQLILKATSVDGKSASTLIRIKSAKPFSRLRFSPSSYTSSLHPGASLFSPLVVVDAKGGHGPLLYSLLDTRGIFAIDPMHGILSVQHPEFVEVPTLGPEFNLTIRATDERGESATTTVRVTMREKEEDKRTWLKFQQDSYTFELVPGETRIGKASIEKTDKEVDYSIAEGGAEGTIQFDPKTGELTYTGEIEKDDYEQTLKLLATSGRHVAFANAKVVVKGIGSLVPKFAEKDPWTFIMKTMEPGLPVYEFNATDGDDDAVLQFSVESVTATDFLGNPVQDPGLRRIFSFPNGSSELVMVEDISALSVLSFRVSVAVTDLSHPNEIPDKTTLTVITEAPKSTKVQPPVLRVNDILELIPISGALPINSYVYTVSARPSMSNSTRNVFAYALLQEDDHFEIHPDTGVIQTIASLRDLNGTTNLTISVSHLPSNTSTLVFAAIQVLPPRDSNPRFESRGYTSKIPEGFPVGKAIVTIAAVDDDGDSIRYELDGEHPEMFSVDEKGEIKLVSALDREELETIQLFVRAIDATNRSDTIPFTITVTDENDESPVFSQEKYTASIMENALEGSYVVSTPATDRDLSPIEYSIRVTNDVAMLAKVLAIDKRGEIRTSGDLSGMVGHFIFEVVASDSIHTAVAEVSLTVVAPLHCHPRFSMDDPRVFVVRENEPEGTVLGKVVAAEMDERCQKRFALFENSTQQYVNRTADASIDPVTGEIRSARAYDYEKEQSIPIIPSLLSHTLSTQMGAEIRVEDDNDNPLFFDQQQLSFTAAEDLSVGSVIGVVSVTELDESDQVFYNLLNDSDGRFAIDRLTGEIRLAMALDREQNDEHVFEVMASNTEKRDEIFESGRLQVHVTVEDVDDNPPVFVAGRREFPLLETTLPGTVLTRVKAVDPDIIEGTGVFYSIESVLFEYRTLVSSVDPNLFSIDAKSGRIRLEKDVREYLGGVFDILVVSSDQEEGAGHHDKIHLRFYVHSSSDVVVFRLPENVATVSIKNITNGARLLSEASQYDVLVIGFEAHKIANKFVRNMTDVHTVFVNKTIGECLSSEKALILLDRAKAAGADVPAAGRLQSTDLPSSEDPITHLVVVLSLVFFAMLSFMMCIFGCCMCHYRLKYQAEKKRQEDLKILAASEKKRTPVQELLPPQLFLTDEKLIERHSSRASFEPIHDSHRYSAQEVSMSFDDKPPVEPEKDYL